MKTKLALFLVVAALTVSAQTNSVHNWTLYSGAVFTGDYFTSGKEMVVIKSHGTNCLLKISELSADDWLYFQDCKAAQRQRQLDAEAVQFQKAGMIEFTAQLIENFPEKVSGKDGWMDAKFTQLDVSAAGSDLSGESFALINLGFDVEDKNGDEFYFCHVRKDIDGVTNPVMLVVQALKRGDRVRLVGTVHADYNSSYRQFVVTRVEMIESAADTTAVKKGKPDLENTGGLNPYTGLPK